jgi:hypothetical protein
MWEQKLDERIRAEDGERKRNWELRNIGRPLPAALDPTAAVIWDKVRCRDSLHSLRFQMLTGFDTS